MEETAAVNAHAGAPAGEAIDATERATPPIRGLAAVAVPAPSAAHDLIDTVARWLLPLLPVALASLWLRLQHAQNGELGFPLDDPYIHFQLTEQTNMSETSVYAIIQDSEGNAVALSFSS